MYDCTPAMFCVSAQVIDIEQRSNITTSDVWFVLQLCSVFQPRWSISDRGVILSDLMYDTPAVFCVSAQVIYIGQRSNTRIEPVGKPYREVCLQTKWWPLKVHQPNSWSKRPGTWIGHVLAYCRVGRKYVGCIELLFKLFRAICIFYHWPNFLLTVHFHRVSPCDLDLCTHKCIQLNNKLLSINWPNMRKIRWKMAEKSQNADSGKEIKK